MNVLKKSVHLGKIKVVYAHIQLDEITVEAENKIIQELFGELEAELLPTRVGIWGISRWGMFRWGRESEHNLYGKMRAPQSSESWVKDLVQALTAIELDLFVSNDKGLRHAIREIRKKMGEAMRCEVYGLENFHEWLNTTIRE